MNRTPLLSLAALPLALAMLLPGCTGSTSGRYPSLLPRAIEKRSEAEPVIEEQVAKPDPALDAQIKALAAAQAASAKAMMPAVARAERAAAAAKGAAAGSERWIEAQSALAELDGYRADASSRLSDLEQLAITRGAEGLPDYPPLETVRAAADADNTAQSERIMRLQALLAAS